MYYEIKQELLNELVIAPDVKFNFNYEYSLAWNQNVNNPSNNTKDALKSAIKNILIEKLQANAEAEHHSTMGKIGAFFSSLLAGILPYITINKKNNASRIKTNND